MLGLGGTSRQYAVIVVDGPTKTKIDKAAAAATTTKTINSTTTNPTMMTIVGLTQQIMIAVFLAALASIAFAFARPGRPVPEPKGGERPPAPHRRFVLPRAFRLIRERLQRWQRQRRERQQRERQRRRQRQRQQRRERQRQQQRRERQRRERQRQRRKRQRRIQRQEQQRQRRERREHRMRVIKEAVGTVVPIAVAAVTIVAMFV